LAGYRRDERWHWVFLFIQKPHGFGGKIARFFRRFLPDLPNILKNWPVKKLRIFWAKNPTNRVE